MDGRRTSGRDGGLAMQVACTSQGNRFLVKAVSLHLGTMYQDALLLRADHLQLLLEHRWNLRVLRSVVTIDRSLVLSLSLMTF